MNGPRIEYVPLEKLRTLGHPNNPKKHDTDALIQSIDRFGFIAPVMVDEKTGRIVAGHGRVEALSKMHADTL